MKIGILLWELNINGGTQRQALELAKNLQDLGNEVIVYSYYFDQNCYPHLSSLLNIKYLKNKLQYENKTKLKLFISTLVKYILFFFEVRQKQLAEIIATDLDILNAHDYHIYPTAGLWKKKTLKPVVWMMNDMPIYRSNMQRPLKTILYYIKPRFKKYIKSFDKVLVLDNNNRKQLLSNINIPAIIIRSGLDIKKLKYYSHPVRDYFILLSVGSFLPHRRIEDSIKALSILVKKDYRIKLIHVGDNSLNLNYSEKIYNTVRTFSLEKHISFYSSVSEIQLLVFYRDANVFIFPNAPQTWGLAVFEAMASGLPVILTSGCGASEIIENDFHAKIVKPYSPESMANAIDELYNNNGLREYLGKNGRSLVENELSWLKYAKNMLNIFQETVNKSKNKFIEV